MRMREPRMQRLQTYIHIYIYIYIYIYDDIYIYVYVDNVYLHVRGGLLMLAQMKIGVAISIRHIP